MKVDEEQRLVYGLVTAEAPDQDGEVCDYATTVPYYKALKEKFLKTTDGKSLAPLREMHQLSAVGAGKEMDFDDDAKAIHMGFKVVDDAAWVKVQEGVYTGFSQGGRYVKTWKSGSLTHYTADPGEISLVDNPCLTTATFEYVKSGGAVELRKFKLDERTVDDAARDMIDRITTAVTDRIGSLGKAEPGLAKEKKTKRVAGEDLSASAFAYVGDPEDTSTWKLPIEFKTDAKTKSHIRNALARLSQTEGIPADEKTGVRKKIVAAAKKHGIEVSDEAAKIFALYKFLHSDALRKGMYDVKDLADVMSTLAFVQQCLANEREYEGDDSAVPEDLLQVMEDLQQVYLDLVAEETGELLEHARAAANGGDKAMKVDTLEKALVQLNKAKDGFGKLKKMLSDQHDATVDMHKGHHSDIIASSNHDKAKALATEHLGKAISHSAGGLSKALDHIEKTAAEMTGGDTDTGGGGVANAGVTLGGEGTDAHTQTGKAVTFEQLQELLTAQNTAFEKKLNDALDANTTNVLKAIFASDEAEGGGAAAAAPGLGDRTQVVVTKAHQTHPVVVTKEGDAAAGGAGGSGSAKVEAPTVEDAKKAFLGSGQESNDAMIKLARSIKADPRGVPATLQGSKLMR